MAKKRTQTGIALNELVASLQKAGYSIPASVNELIKQQDALKTKPASGAPIKNPLSTIPHKKKNKTPSKIVDKPKSKPRRAKIADPSQLSLALEPEPVKEGGPALEEVKAEPTTPKRKHVRKSSSARGLIKAITGKDLSNKITSLKKIIEPQLSANENQLKAIRINVEQIKDQIKDLKHHRIDTQGLISRKNLDQALDTIRKQLDKTSPTNQPTPRHRAKKQLLAGFIRGATAGHLRIQKWESGKLIHAARGEGAKVKAYKHNSVKHVAVRAILHKLSKPQARVQAANLANKLAAKISPPTQESDQNIESDLRKQDSEIEARKSLYKRLKSIDKRLSNLEKEEKRGHGLGAAVMAAIAGALAFMKGLPGRILKAIPKIIIKAVKSVWNLAKKVGNGIKKVGKMAWNGIKKGWEKLKGIGKDAEGAAEEGTVEAETIGSKLGNFLKVGGKALGVAGAGVDVGMGVHQLLEGKQQTHMPEGWNTLDPMKWGMYAGDKINNGITDALGEPLGDKIYDLTHKQPKTIPTAKINPLSKHLAVATATAKDVKNVKDTEPKIVVIKGGDTTKVIPAPAQQDITPAVFISAHNPEPSINRLNSFAWDDVAGYSGTSRL